MRHLFKVFLLLPILAMAALDPRVATTEVKVGVHPASIDTLLTDLDLKSKDALQSKIYFFDQPDLKFFKRGLILRARKRAGKEDDTTVKLRPILNLDLIPKEFFDLKGFKCELDVGAKKAMNSCSLSNEVPSDALESVVSGKKEAFTIFTKRQSVLSELKGLDLTSAPKLKGFGPIYSYRWTFEYEGQEIDAELWVVGKEKTRFFELSSKGKAGKAKELLQGLRALLLDYKAQENTSATSKTEAALNLLVRP